MNKTTPEHFYINEDGLVVFTEQYHIERGYCCGNGCRHCPFDYQNVPEPKRSQLQNAKEKNNNSKSPKLTSIKPSVEKDNLFFEQVFEIARQIPKSRVTSYGAIAQCVGVGKSARLVGWAMNKSGSIAPKVPAHRVVNSSGLLTGKNALATPTLMEELLEKEGIEVKNNRVVLFKKIFWNPAKEL